MLFETLAEVFERLETTSSRLQLTAILTDLFKKADPEDIDKVVYLVQGELWPQWRGEPELGVGEKLLIKAISISLSVPEAEVERLYKKHGDLGRVVEHLKAVKRTQGGGLTAFMGKQARKLSVSEVYNSLVKVARLVGEGSRDLKIKILVSLLQDASPKEAKYIVRLVEGNLRLGVGDATIMDALAIAFGGSDAMRSIVERAYNLRADLGNIASILAREGIEALKELKPEVGIPIRPMLAERLDNAREILEKVGGKAIAEYKYDGERAQIHKKGDQVYIFSRRLENITHQYPDVVEMVKKHVKAREAIVEGEIVAIDPETGDMRPFQELMHRKRKHDVSDIAKKYPVVVRLFDALYVDGQDLTGAPLPQRREILERIVEQSQSFSIANYIVTDDPEELDRFFLKALEDGCEGIVVKAIHQKAIYQAGARGWLWIKYKRDYKSEMIDSVDLVVVGAFYGRGRRAGLFGTVLLAAYDPQNDVFKTVCKVGTGFTDQDLAEMNKMLQPLIINHRHPRVVSDIEPDVWVVPQLVMEVIGAELTLSPLHTCCKDAVRKGAGVSIRFPRFIRWRPDKRPEDATTEKELLEMYIRQLKKISEEGVEQP
ncbi:MAG: ATP-dependent DNA ligase [Sulfolobales archaeon]